MSRYIGRHIARALALLLLAGVLSAAELAALEAVAPETVVSAAVEEVVAETAQEAQAEETLTLESPRRGRYGTDGKPRALPGHNLVRARNGAYAPDNFSTGAAGVAV